MEEEEGDRRMMEKEEEKEVGKRGEILKEDNRRE